MKSSNTSRLAYLDVLKAIAIIAVVLFHSGFLTYGYLGVDIFLVIGGYLITKSLWKRIITPDNSINSSSSPRGSSIKEYFIFIVSRLERLLPALLVVGAVSMFVGWFTMLPDDYENLSESVIATNLFGNNILAAITTKDYWAVANDYKPLMHTWYVGVVMQFYLVYPFLFSIARRTKETRSTLLTLIATFAVVSLLLYFGTTSAANRFYYLPSRFFEFAVGGLIALSYDPEQDRPFGALYTYISYTALLVLIILNKEILPDQIRLVLVVALTCVLILSEKTLSNKVLSYHLVAWIGVASYSIYVWHQVVLAFYRYVVTNHFTVISYLAYLSTVALLSWLSYKFIEKGIPKLFKQPRRKKWCYLVIIIGFVSLSAFAGYIYVNAGVVRDIPELYVSKQDRHRNMHAEYCDRAYKFDKSFETTNKAHWLIVGNSFGRDFVNIILESEIADSIDVSYIDISNSRDYKKPGKRERFGEADRVFISTLGLTEELVTDVEIQCLAKGLSLNKITIVGEKDFGESNGQVYAKRKTPYYFDQYVEVKDRIQFIEKNRYFSDLYGSRYLDLMSLVTNAEGKVRVFTPDHHYISPDTRHLSKGGALFFSELINWNLFK